MSKSGAREVRLGDDVQYLPGVGPSRAAHLNKLGIRTAGDLLEYFPVRHTKTESRTIENLDEGMYATVVGRIAAVQTRMGRLGRSVAATLIDNTGRCGLTWFNAPWMVQKLERGMVVRATGRVGAYRDLPQLVNPKIAVLSQDAGPISEREPARFDGVYPATAGLSSEQIGRLIHSNLDRLLAQVQECHSDGFLKERTLSGRRWALQMLHRPTNDEDAEQARRRLAYDELLLMQLAVQIGRRQRRSGATALALPVTAEIDARIRRRFPFPLTGSQDKAVKSIAADLSKPVPMNRLLQGDVGCGKTVVALYAALTAVAHKAQAAIMAPTELLAEQHARSIERFLAGSRVQSGLLTGNLKAGRRRQVLAAIASGDMNIVVGTHALIQEDVQFAGLGLVIVDEQHRFGVRQRAIMRGKGPAPHYLVMTATPIPRTLAMTVFGDLDVTTIDELPPGRAPITTRVCLRRDQPATWEFIRRRLETGEQAYVVYPIIDESDKTELRAATSEYERLKDSVFPRRRVGLMHGRLTTEERDAVMQDFAAGRIDVLVSTTVIEVGIDVANATCIVIEHAERYGLSQLHQLRGRVGRGEKPGWCFLMVQSSQAGENERLGVLAQTNDGFEIAEADLRLRGPGEMMGTRQHGLPELRAADLLRDGELLRMAQRDAESMLQSDARLRRREHVPIREMLTNRYGDALGMLDVA